MPNKKAIAATSSALLNSLAEKLADMRELDSEIRCIAAEVDKREIMPVFFAGDIFVLAGHGALPADDFVELERALIATANACQCVAGQAVS